MLPTARIKLPSIAELTACTAVRQSQPCLGCPALPSLAALIFPTEVPLSAVPHNVGMLPQKMLPSLKSNFGAHHGGQTVFPLPSVSHNAASLYPSFESTPDSADPIQPQLSPDQHPYNNYPVYHLPVGSVGMQLSEAVFHSSNKPYALMPIVIVTDKTAHTCQRCGATETPEWRRGPNGLRTLCNACGLFHAKLVKKKGADLAAAEVLNNKVYKASNGRRVAVRKATFDGENYPRY